MPNILCILSENIITENSKGPERVMQMSGDISKFS